MRALFAGVVAAGSAFAIVGSVPCFAQMGPGMTPLNAGQRAAHAGEAQPKAQVAPPPVLPGTKAAPEAAAPSEGAASMTPTEALFDAINRGDLAAARDAVNRGADMKGQNVLGLTPLELAVDLGRNDISFMLVSMRGEDAAARDVARKGGVPEQKDAVLRASASARAVGRSRVATASVQAADEPVAATPRFYSGGGGAPIPAAGFVGFDPGRAVR